MDSMTHPPSLLLQSSTLLGFCIDEGTEGQLGPLCPVYPQVWGTGEQLGCKWSPNGHCWSKESDLVCMGCMYMKNGINVDNTSQSTVVTIEQVTVLYFTSSFLMKLKLK